MITFVRVAFLIGATVVAFFAAFVAAPWALIEIRIPATLVGTVAGAVVFFVTLIALVLLGKLTGDMILFRSCREFLGEMLIEKWRDWKCVVPSLVVGVIFGFLLGSMNGVLAGFVLYVFIMTAIYTYGCMQVEAVVGDLLYNNEPPEPQ